jgi:hypothetical protein
MTPKSLLRHPMCISDADDFTTGSTFHRVLWDDAQKGHSDLKLKADAKIKRVVICSGKVYYDLLAERDKRGQDDTYLLRLEQFYPFPAMSMVKELERFKGAEVIWCQEEPKNQGGWTFVEPNLEWVLSRIGAKHKRATYAGRAASRLARHRPRLAAQGRTRGAGERSARHHRLIPSRPRRPGAGPPTTGARSGAEEPEDDRCYGARPWRKRIRSHRFDLVQEARRFREAGRNAL